MTRINLVPPSELMDQHLFAEFREIKMVPRALYRSLKARGLYGVLRIIPRSFTLNRGHVSFFYDKGRYLRKRYKELRKELRRRGINFNEDSRFDPEGLYRQHPELDNDYQPTKEALRIIRTRIAEKIAMKPEWYRYSGKQSVHR